MEVRLQFISALALGLSSVCPASVFAQAAKTVDVATAGTLSTLISDAEKYTVSELTVSGSLNGDDVLFLREMAGRDIASNPTEGTLQKLDLSDANIVYGGGNYFEQNQWNKATTADDIIGAHCFEKSTLVSLVLPKTIGQIEGDAFSNSSSLTEIVIPEQVNRIGSYAFTGCSSLTTFTFPNVKTVAGSVLSGCTSITKVYLPETVTDVEFGVFDGCANLTELHCAATAAPSCAWKPFQGLDVTKCTLYVPTGCATAYKAASYWGDFTNIVEESTDRPLEPIRTVDLTEPGTLANYINDTEKFATTELTVTGEINSDDVRLIREMAGRDNIGNETDGKLTKLDLSGARFVSGGSPYLNIYNNDWYTKTDTITQYMFDHCKLESITLPENIKVIEAAFGDCYYLTGTFTVPQSVTRIGNYAFAACTQVEHFVLPSQLVDNGYSEPALGSNVFAGCHLLKDITIPEGVTRIKGSTCYDCDALEEVTIPSTVTYIDGSAFAKCPNIKAIHVNRATPMSVGYEAFDESLYETCVVYVPAGAVEAYKANDSWNAFKMIVEEGTEIPTAIDNIGATDTANADAIYTLGGAKTEKIGKGMYIVVKNGKAHKIVK